mgnify:CR=1 FL=1
MKKLGLSALFVLLIASAAAASSGPTLQYYSPRDGTFSANAVTFKWTIHSWDPVEKVVLVIQGFQNDGDMYKNRFEFYGNEAKRMSCTVTDLLPNGQYGWGLEVYTPKQSGAFGLGMIGEFKTK